MSNSFLSVIGSIATVALISFATRWLATSNDAQVPKVRDGTSVYGIKWPWQAVGLAGGAFGIGLSIWSWRDLHRPEWGLVAISVTFVTLGFWVASGSVTTSRAGITKTVLWASRSFRWCDITEIRLLKKDVGAIELRAGSQKLVNRFRFVAFQHLLKEIEARTKLHPSDP